MSMLGKILAVVNILAAIGFIYLAASDYGKRQQWSYAVYRHDLAIDGLPLDEKETDLDGVARVKNLNQATQADMFQPAGGQPVTTQLAEVLRVQNALHARIDDGQAMTVANPLTNQPLQLDTPEQKRAWFLLPLARTLTDRDVRLNQLLVADPKLTAEVFDQVFTDVQARTDPGDKRQ